jgi:hypothetical protein
MVRLVRVDIATRQITASSAKCGLSSLQMILKLQVITEFIFVPFPISLSFFFFSLFLVCGRGNVTLRCSHSEPHPIKTRDVHKQQAVAMYYKISYPSHWLCGIMDHHCFLLLLTLAAGRASSTHIDAARKL